jgi:hypothetical protein
MATSIAALLWKLRRVERSVPGDIRRDDNFLGLRVDESGRFVSIAQLFFDPASAAHADAAAGRLSRQREFRAALDDAALELIDDDGRAGGARPHTCSAGDGAYAARCSDHCYTANRSDAGTLGWFFCLDGQPLGIGSYHVLCPRGDDTPLHTTCVYRCADADADDFRIGSLWNYDRADAAGKRLFDCALVRVDDPGRLTGALAICDNGARRPYPQELAAEADITGDERFYMVGMHTKTWNTTSFKGVGSRKLAHLGKAAMFHEQLFFERCSDAGDSGAILVHERSNRVVGLTMAADALFTIANPLYRKPWRNAGTRTIRGVTLPDLRVRA